MQNPKDGAAQANDDRRAAEKPKGEARPAPEHGRDEKDAGRREFGRDG